MCDSKYSSLAGQLIKGSEWASKQPAQLCQDSKHSISEYCHNAIYQCHWTPLDAWITQNFAADFLNFNFNV